MATDPGLALPEDRRDFADRQLAPDQQEHDPEAGLLSDRAKNIKCGIKRHGTCQLEFSQILSKALKHKDIFMWWQSSPANTHDRARLFIVHGSQSLIC